MMYPKKSRPVILLALVLLLSGLIGSAVGKYVQTVTFPGKVTFSAKLADSIVLQEHEAVRQEDGSYTLNGDKTVMGNHYRLLPGLDIPKDPHILIANKTSIPAYLFVEVVNELTDTALVYTVDTEHWLLLGDLGGKNGGRVYVYTDDGKDPTEIDDTFTKSPVYILKDNQVEVRQGLKHSTAADNLIFYACMGETAFSSEENLTTKAAEVYKRVNGMN